jgi:actin related protein 2/3 complex subunit 5
MSIIQQVTSASLSDNWRTINIDALDPDSSTNFDTSTLRPSLAPVSESEIRSIGQQVRQLLRGGDAEGALRGALESAPYGGDDSVKEIHLGTVVEVLQGIRASEISGILGRIWGSEGGSEVVDCLMKYLWVALFFHDWSSFPTSNTWQADVIGESRRNSPLGTCVQKLHGIWCRGGSADVRQRC